MIHESYAWKEDLLQRKEEIIRFNCHTELLKEEKSDEEIATIHIEKGIFYTAFIIRKLLDCKSKLSDEADKYALNVKIYNAKKHLDIINKYADNDMHDWNNPITKTKQGRNVCNWLIHSFVFMFNYDEEQKKYVSFLVSSDNDRNKYIYEITFSDWIKYVDFIASDDIVELEIKYDDKHKERICTRKKRGIESVGHAIKKFQAA